MFQEGLRPPLDLLPPLLAGLQTTIVLLLFGGAIAIVAGAIAGTGRWAAGTGTVGRRSKPLSLGLWLWSWLAASYTEVFRGSSALVQLFWFYFVLPRFGVDISAIVAGVLVLGLNTGAYGAEVVRGALNAVPRVQHLAARALGLGPFTTFVRVLLPQAAIRMVPPAGNLLIELLKNTALVSTIALSDITFRAQALRSETLRTVEIFALALVLYFLIAQAIAFLTRRLELRLSRQARFAGVTG